MTLRIAMWSGPRNVSTALMRSFGSRADTVVVDEPLYAHYLAETGLDHPGREAIMASQSRDWVEVARQLSVDDPGAPVQFQKHMAHHLLPSIGRDWLSALAHAFLIRPPAAVVASYARVRERPTPADLGYAQQVEIFRRHGGPVVDSTDLLRDPSAVLARLCQALGLPPDVRMLSWAPGPRAADGVWARYWYSAVEQTSGFAPYVDKPVDVPAELASLVETLQPYYDELAAHRI